HDRREGPELDPAGEDLPIAELLVAAGVGAPDGKPIEGVVQLREDRGAQAEIGRPAAEILARHIAGREDDPVLAAGVAAARIDEEVIAPYPLDGVVMHGRGEHGIRVAHFGAGAAVEVHVGGVRWRVFVAAIELETGEAHAYERL